MKITKIEQQKKRNDRYSIYVDDTFACGVTESQLVELGLSRGQELDDASYKELLDYSVTGKAYDQALGQIARRPRSEKEIRDYLAKKAYDQPTIDAVVAKLYKIEMLDDTRFARDWVVWRSHTTPRSKQRLRSELLQKGIDSEVIQSTLAHIPNEVELEQLRDIISKRAHRYSSREKLMAYLARQGYSYDQIKTALRDFDQET